MLKQAHGSMVIGEKVYKMRKLVFKYIVLLLLVSLSISGCTYDNNDDITYKTNEQCHSRNSILLCKRK